MIKPTVGRVVHYFDRKGLRVEQPQAALITYVHNDRLVNLTAMRPSGEIMALQSVVLWHGERGIDEEPASAFCCWMPYQKAVASGALPPTLHAEPKTDG
jgi:hypothetical protein